MASATIKARITDSTNPVLLVSTDSGLAGATQHTGTSGADSIWTWALTGLAANTTYYYGWSGSSVTGTFKTFPTTATTFTIAAGSCAGSPGSGDDYPGAGDTSNTPVFDRITDRAPLLFIHMGDRGYPDISTNSVSAFRTNYRDNLTNARQKAMHMALPVAYQWNDHDFGTNDSNGSSASRPAAQQTYREHVPHWELPADTRDDGDGEIYQTFAIGRVRFVLLDDRSERSPNSATDNSSKTMLGADQKAWLKDLVETATEKVIVICCGAPWNGNDSISWGVFSTERDELIDHFDTEGVTDKLFMLHGDHHFAAADDGTNSPGGIPTACFSPMDNTFTTNDGTWSEGIFKESKQQYGTLTFTDTGGATITLTAKAYEVHDAAEAELFSMDIVYDAS